jgi:predicted transcriptional regulator
MDTLTIDDETFNTINTLANQLNASPTEIVRQALNEYVEKRQRKNRLMSYAGILEEQEADAMLSSIRENRAGMVNGEW